MIPRTLLLCAALLVGALAQEAAKPAPTLLEALDDVNRVWGATEGADCREAIEATFAPEAELFLTVRDFRGVLPREALLAMAAQLEASPGLERGWETDEASWYLGEDLAVRKAHERLQEAGSTRTVLTTQVFARTDDTWTLVHAHHSGYDPPEER